MKKILQLIVFQLFAVGLFGQATKVNLEKLALPGGNSEILTTTSGGAVDWAAIGPGISLVGGTISNSGVVTASNGLTLTSGNVKLGSTTTLLDGQTQIKADATHTLDLVNGTTVVARVGNTNNNFLIGSGSAYGGATNPAIVFMPGADIKLVLDGGSNNAHQYRGISQQSTPTRLTMQMTGSSEHFTWQVGTSTTTSAELMRLEGSGELGLGVTAPDGWLDVAANTTGVPNVHLTTSAGVNVATPVNGDLWWNGTNLNFYNGSATKDLLADNSATNEGLLTVTAQGGNSSGVASNTSGNSDVIFSGGTGVTIIESGQTITISATGSSPTWSEEEFNPTTGTTVTTSTTPTDTDQIFVYFNGVYLDWSVDTTDDVTRTNATTITFNQLVGGAFTSGDKVVVKWMN